jgi:hypothetical protein
MTAYEKLQERIEEMKKNGLEHIHISRYGGNELNKEELCQEILVLLDAEEVKHFPGMFEDENPVFVKSF